MLTPATLTRTDPSHYCEGAARLRTGAGFFRQDSRPARDLGVLLARLQAAREPLHVLDGMAGCGIRSLRYGLEAGAASVWANDADAARLPVLEANLEAAPPGLRVRTSGLGAQRLLADCLGQRLRFGLVDLDAFGSPGALLPLALEAVALEGVLYLASSDGRSPTGHDRPAAVRHLGAAARAHPASWELALRLQLGLLAREAWMQGRGILPLLSFSEGRTFRTAVRLRRRASAGEEAWLGMVAHCHGCGDQQVQSLLRLDRWRACGCAGGLAVSGPLWIGPLQHGETLGEMERLAAESPACRITRASRRLLARLGADPGLPARSWPMAEIGRRLGAGPPPLRGLVEALRAEGHAARVSGVMEGQLRSDAPWPRILATARRLASPATAR